ncbi:MAG: hypothetical protein ACNI3A_19075 [Desulfovibrio sp.]|uniref:hypothetical protein n=1 Tax=Desulfovibrio sp. 7SRBS1 TaxID=3378064 RepID=UPI003B41BB58
MSLHKTLATALGICAAGFVLWMAMSMNGKPTLIDTVRAGHIENIPSRTVGQLVTLVSRQTAVWTIDDTGQMPLALAWWSNPDKERIRLEFSAVPENDGLVRLERVLVNDVDQGWMAKGHYLDAFTRLARGESLEKAFAR